MTSQNRFVRFAPVAVGSLIAASGLLFAGPLDPPAGPIASTYKTLAEVEPGTPVSSVNTPADADSMFRISSPGRYYLVGNITGVAGRNGIKVDADGVTLDLRGYDMTGVPGSLDGVRVVPGHRGVTVRDGSLRGWGASGLSAVGGPNADGCLYQDLRVTATGTDDSNVALDVGGGSTILNCVAVYNLGTGIRGNNGTIIAECAASGNAGDGIICGAGTVRNCLARGNVYDGIRVGASIVSGCTATANSGAGITIHDGAIASDNTCFANTWGIYVYSEGSRVDGNSLYGNTIGLEVAGEGNFVMRNTFRANATTFTSTPGNDSGPFDSASTATSPWANLRQ